MLYGYMVQNSIEITEQCKISALLLLLGTIYTVYVLFFHNNLLNILVHH